MRFANTGTLYAISRVVESKNVIYVPDSSKERSEYPRFLQCFAVFPAMSKVQGTAITKE